MKGTTRVEKGNENSIWFKEGEKRSDRAELRYHEGALTLASGGEEQSIGGAGLFLETVLIALSGLLVCGADVVRHQDKVTIFFLLSLPKGFKKTMDHGAAREKASMYKLERESEWAR